MSDKPKPKPKPNLTRPSLVFASATELYKVLNETYKPREDLVGLHRQYAEAMLEEFTALRKRNRNMNASLLIKDFPDQPLTISQVNEMTVGDLKELLAAFPDDCKVVFPEAEGGFNPIHGMKLESLVLNVNDEYWYGKHDWPCSIDPDQLAEKTTESCVILMKA